MASNKEKTRKRGLFEQNEYSIDSDAFTPDASLLSALIHSLPLNIYAKDKEGRFIFANNFYCRNVGKNREDILGKTDFDIHPGELAEKYLADDHMSNDLKNRLYA